MSITTNNVCPEIKTTQENLLLEMVKELCSESKLSAKLKGKVCRIIADNDLTEHSSLHRLSNADEGTSTLLGFLHQPAEDLTFDEQAELNQAIIKKIETKLPAFAAALDNVKQTSSDKKTCKDRIRQFQSGIDDKLNKLQDQENEKVELMMEWVEHRLNDLTKFSDDESELLTLKTRILELKSKILHLQVLQNIFTETGQSIKAYGKIYNDLKDTIKEVEQKIGHYKDIIDSDINN